jgi:hypothetical protein
MNVNLKLKVIYGMAYVIIKNESIVLENQNKKLSVSFLSVNCNIEINANHQDSLEPRDLSQQRGLHRASCPANAFESRPISS